VLPGGEASRCGLDFISRAKRKRRAFDGDVINSQERLVRANSVVKHLDKFPRKQYLDPAVTIKLRDCSNWIVRTRIENNIQNSNSNEV
jgi:hypothetical protein